MSSTMIISGLLNDEIPYDPVQILKTQVNYKNYVSEYNIFYTWYLSSLDAYKPELSNLLFPLFSLW